jgi:hypothetical protein
MLYLKSKLNLLPNRNKISVKVWAQKYVIQEFAHRCDVWNCLADKISCTFRSDMVIPVIKIDFKCSCDSEVRYLDLTYFSELRHAKEAVKPFMMAVLRTLVLQETVKHFLGVVKITYAFPVTCSLIFSHLIVLCLCRGSNSCRPVCSQTLVSASSIVRHLLAHLAE